MTNYHKVGCYFVSEDVFTSKFLCDYENCKGACCYAETDFEAVVPLSSEEAEELRAKTPQLIPYMHEKSDEPVYDYDGNGYMSAVVCGDGHCVFHDAVKGCCGIKEAYNDGVSSFPIPVSCHLFPLDLDMMILSVNRNFGQCKSSFDLGEKCGMWLIDFLACAIERSFGSEFLDELRERQKYVLKRKGIR